MADDLEKFVLQYNVELKDSIQKLNDLQARIESTNKKGEEGAKKVDDGMKTITEKLDKIIPGLSSATGKASELGGAIKNWSPGILAATAGLAAMAYAMKQVNLLRQEYDAQRLTAWNTGMSPIQVEQHQRELTMASGGRLSGSESRNLMENIQSKVQAAYTDPNPANETNLRLRMAGTYAYGQNGQMKSASDALDEIGNKMRHVSQEQANAIGQTLGLTQNETAALMNRNAAVIESQKLSDEEVTRRVAANAAMESLNSSFGKIDESMRQTGSIIGAEFMPVLSDVMEVIADWVQSLPGTIDKATTAFRLFSTTFELFMQDIQDPKKVLTGELSWEKNQKQAAEIIAKQNEAARAAADKQADAAETQKQNAANNEKSIKLFTQAVNTMAGVVDEQQAWAAWAGSVGRAAGLKGMGEGAAGVAQNSGGGNGNMYGGYTPPEATSSADSMYNTGNLRSSQGGFRKYNNYQEGMMAQGNQLVRYYEGKTTGRKLQSVNDIIATWAPSNENNTEAYIKYMSEKMKVKSSDKLDFSDTNVLGKFMYYQAIYEKGADKLKGLTERDFQASAAALQNRQPGGRQDGPSYPPTGRDFQASADAPQNQQPGGRQNGPSYPPTGRDLDSTATGAGDNPNVHAESKSTVRLNEIFQSVSSYIGGGMTVAQMRNGGAQKSDIRWGLNKDIFESEKSVATLRQQVASPQLQKNKAEYENQLLQAEQHLQALRVNYNTVLGTGRGDVNGPRSITVDRPQYNINIYGQSDPQGTATAVSKVLSEQTDDIVNNNNSGKSH